MGNCSCVNDEPDHKGTVSLETTNLAIQSKPKAAKVSAGQSEQPQVQVFDAPLLDQSGSSRPDPKPSRRIYSYNDVVTLQSLARGYLERKQIERTIRDQLVWPDTEDARNETGEETTIDPLTKLTVEARATLLRRSPVRYDRGISGAFNSKAKRLIDNSVYLGQWAIRRDGKQARKGIGKLYSSDGSYAEGYWWDGKLHLNGLLILANGDYYEGSFDHGLRDGYGKFETYDGKNLYIGNWLKDKRSGRGTETYTDGSRYEGNFVNDLRNGRGELVYRDQSRYKGDFQNGAIHGQGKYNWADGREYEGQWVGGKMHGNGRFKYSDGKTYVGDYVSDKKEGFGVYEWEGKKYEGNWVAGKMHGRGHLTTEKGRRLYEFKEGNRGAEIKEQ